MPLSRQARFCPWNTTAAIGGAAIGRLPGSHCRPALEGLRQSDAVAARGRSAALSTTALAQGAAAPESGLLGLRRWPGSLIRQLRPVEDFHPGFCRRQSLRRSDRGWISLAGCVSSPVAFYFGTPKGRIEADGQVRAFKHDGLQRFSKSTESARVWFQVGGGARRQALQC